jgi:hypothetical protein
MRIFSRFLQVHSEDTANVRNVYVLEINNGCPTNISKCIGVCPVISRNSETVFKVICDHREYFKCPCSKCTEDMMTICSHNQKKKTHKRKNISIDCYCAVNESKLITPMPDGVQG